MSGAAVRLTHVVIGGPDIDALAAFWAVVLDGTVVPAQDEDWREVHVDGAPVIAAQLSPNHRSPHWPDGVPQQIHLDLAVDDIAAAHERVVAAGADVLEPPAGPDATRRAGFQVYADPAGHPFCLTWGQ